MLIHPRDRRSLTCIFVDNGLLRHDEAHQIQKRFREKLQLPLDFVDATDLFLERLAGVTDPEQKRKIIGATFIDVFETRANELGGFDFLGQGTLYPDVIESASVLGPAVVIKSHHNVGGLPGAHEVQARRAAARSLQGRSPARRAAISASIASSSSGSRSRGPASPCG